MTTDREDSAPDDARRFERLLLDSALADTLPQDVGGAWARFGASLASVAELSAASTVATGVRTPGQASSARGGADALGRALRVTALKWLLVGALTGSALTALGLSRTRDWRSAPAVAQVSTVALATPSVARVPSAAFAPISTESGVASAVPVARRAPPKIHRDAPLAHGAISTSSTGTGSATGAPAQSTLGAQVALLDAARTASASGAFGEALSLIDRYQTEFPSGELAPDAEVVALEALAAQGDSEALTERAARFLARYPGDPHVARVKELARR